MNFLVRELRLVLLALQFLTRVPVPAWVGYDARLMRRAVRHFPLVGALVGAFGAAIGWAASGFWSPMVAAALAVAATVWLTAAFHEDGLADTFDALLGAAPREKALAIMKDSRIGTYGGVALVLTLLLRVLLLGELLAHDVATALAVLVAAQAAGRSAAVVLMASLPHARGDGVEAAPAKVGDLSGEGHTVDALWALAVGLFGLAVAAWTQAAAPLARLGSAVLVTASLVMLLRRWFERRLGGQTGDTLGATQQLVELAVLLVFAAA